MTVALVIALLAGLLVIGLPVALAMAISGSVGLYLFGGMAVLGGILKTAPLSTANSYEIITIPMFILMAEFVIISGVAQDLFRAATIWVGRLRGGLAMATAVAGAGFGAISGSSTAAAATLASTSIPAMIDEGYDPKLASGVVAISGTLAMLIPPSVALILYGIIADVSVGQLLVAGVIPGILVALTIMATVAVLVRIDPSVAPAGQPYSFRDKFASLSRVGPMLLLFLAVTGTIYSGIATPTEASGIGAFGAMLLALHERKLGFSQAWGCLRRAAQTTCMILFVILGAHIFGYFFTLTRVTNDLTQWIGGLGISPMGVMVVILIIYVFLGAFMDQIAILILTVPVLLPLVLSLGFDPIWFGVIVVVTAEVGMVTPPLGMNVFVVARYTRRPLGEIFRGTFPHVLAHLLVIALLTAFPVLVLWLPSTMN
ncbi:MULTISPECIES: TRAP transporter large permease [Alphaproteobacteria]|uniref:TRAP transporter large permease protein n=4 Tax=Rhodobacterales TaxID=204455 RepID=A0A1I7ACE5_9RHOB|nr:MULTISPECIES: TRAP transporter large permease subunit [Alphaproteobacteria]MBL3704901.1 TRAP transporter large permease subunit [Sulfitobacter sp. BDSS02]MBR9851809.1 TRAP transporter large permease subunit [Paracoccaceae bacterium]MCS5602179.1 TRAP transporter large permease subunit [Paracoccus sp. (in: a-proteobacteria)]SDO52901.1 TRAP transporter, DctM subunit [Lutimaribacter pacificus]APE46136.1 C4-dicarboxylate ABC transporter permease [Sulfitobacter alexandrii]